MWHELTEDEILSRLGTDINQGLTDEEARKRQANFGLNELNKSSEKSLLSLIKEQFEDLMVLILLVAALISAIIAVINSHEGIIGFVEPIMILLILAGNTAVGVWQESSADSAMEALRNMQSDAARALRGGQWKLIAARELVPGDIVQVTEGVKAPADIRIVKLLSPDFKVDESSLTGESMPISKYPHKCSEGGFGQQSNIVFSPCYITSGTSIAVVVEIGMNTMIGKLQSLMPIYQQGKCKTPLHKELEKFGKLLVMAILGICILVWAMNYRNFYDEIHGSPVSGAIYYFKLAVALTVAAVPEGLPIVITTCLALGKRRMAKRNVIVGVLSSVETLGRTTIICSDKTGILTANKLTVTDFCIPSSQDTLQSCKVEGHAYEPTGKILGLKPEEAENSAGFKQFVNAAHFCNKAKLENEEGRWTIIGPATDGALRVLVEKIGKFKGLTSDYASELDESGIKKIVNLEFTAQRKCMSVLCSQKSGGNILYTKGAPEQLLGRSSHVLLPEGLVPLSDQMRAKILQSMEKLGPYCLRFHALASKEDLGELSTYTGPSHSAHSLLEDTSNYLQIESRLTFLGLVGIRDLPHPGVKDSIALCKHAGIRVFMLTGDNSTVAESIASELGISDDSSLSLAGHDVQSMTEQDLADKLRDCEACVFSRITPHQKYMIVRALESLGETVAVTGDGANDGPALKAASVGVAMGISGTDVAKSAADVILTDDRFETIVAAVEEGRLVGNNTKAFIRYLISSNIGEIVSIFVAAMLGVPGGLTSVQLLWVNLVTDGLPATALGFNPPDRDIMDKPPRKKGQSLVTSWDFLRCFVIGVYIGTASLGIFVYWYLFFESEDGHPLVEYAHLSKWAECPGWTDFKLPSWGGLDLEHYPCMHFTEGKVKANTLALSVLVTAEMFNALNALSEDLSILQKNPWGNPWLLIAIASSMILHCTILYIPFFNTIFGILPLNCKEWILVLAFSTPVILIDEVLKIFRRARNNEILLREKRKLE